MCLAHSRYAGCNNNMGIKVSWRDIKKLLPPNCSLGQFLGALCHYIKTCLGEEHMHWQRLGKVGSCNAFTRKPISTKEMWDGVQSTHSKTLSCCFVVMTSPKRSNVQIDFRDMMEEIMECWPRTLPLYLKIDAWHDDQSLDPTGKLSITTVHTQLEPLVRQYDRLVIQDRVDDGTHLRDALKIYNHFLQLNRAPEWGEIALSCSCRVCFGKCMCKHTLLFVSLFKPDVRVPDSWIAATPSLRKKCNSLKGTAGRRRLRLIEQRKCDEKSMDSKVTFLQAQCRALHHPPF